MYPFRHNMASWAEKPKGLRHKLPPYNNNKQNVGLQIYVYIYICYIYIFVYIYIYICIYIYIGGIGTSYRKGDFVCLHPPKKDAFLSIFNEKIFFSKFSGLDGCNTRTRKGIE